MPFLARCVRPDSMPHACALSSPAMERAPTMRQRLFCRRSHGLVRPTHTRRPACHTARAEAPAACIPSRAGAAAHRVSGHASRQAHDQSSACSPPQGRPRRSALPVAQVWAGATCRLGAPAGMHACNATLSLLSPRQTVRLPHADASALDCSALLPSVRLSSPAVIFQPPGSTPGRGAKRLACAGEGLES